uniref:Protease n=1 Tax=Retroviridae sp. TaxID=2681591 RepID=A0A8K1WLB0_9RETR|nr:MAG: protease [Retroviridae sp.]
MKGQRLAQALPLPLSTSHPAIHKQRGSSTPGSSDLYWIQAITKERPTLKLKIQGKVFEGILDSGADSTVISQASWPSSWPLHASLTHLQGIGQSRNTLQSSQLLNWEDEEGNTGFIQPFVVPGLPVNLWGRDILSQMKVIMCSPNEVVTQQMLSQGYLPGQGLGKLKQGDPNPILATPKIDRSGLGFEKHFS